MSPSTFLLSVMIELSNRLIMLWGLSAKFARALYVLMGRSAILFSLQNMAKSPCINAGALSGRMQFTMPWICSTIRINFTNCGPVQTGVGSDHTAPDKGSKIVRRYDFLLSANGHLFVPISLKSRKSSLFVEGYTGTMFWGSLRTVP